MHQSRINVLFISGPDIGRQSWLGVAVFDRAIAIKRAAEPYTGRQTVTIRKAQTYLRVSFNANAPDLITGTGVTYDSSACPRKKTKANARSLVFVI
jgi:hypothetical protein